jgi:carbonic anhydrase
MIPSGTCDLPYSNGCHCGSARRLSRRRVLARAAAAIVTGAIPGAFLDLVAPVAARAASAVTPDQALQQLIDGNRRFTEGRMTAFDEDLAILKQKTAGKQEPFAAVLSCADSRVPVELIFDQSIGHLFVTRVAGNVASSEVIASLEYGAAVLGTKMTLVLGHSSCGAVKASIDAKPVPGQISGLYRYIRPAVDQAGTDVDAVGKANAKIQAAILREASPVLAGLIEKKSFKVLAGFYDLASGKVEILS